MALESIQGDLDEKTHQSLAAKATALHLIHRPLLKDKLYRGHIPDGREGQSEPSVRKSEDELNPSKSE